MLPSIWAFSEFEGIQVGYSLSSSPLQIKGILSKSSFAEDFRASTEISFWYSHRVAFIFTCMKPSSSRASDRFP